MSWNSHYFHYLALLSLIGFGVASIGEMVRYQLKSRNILACASTIAFVIGFGACIAVELSLLVVDSEGRISHPLAGFLLASLLSVGVLYLRFVRKLDLITVLASPVITLILFIQIFFVPTARLHATLTASGMATSLSFHIYASVFGQACAILAAVVSACYLFVDYHVKRKNMIFLMQSSSSLKTLKNLMLGLLWCGFIFMSIGLVSGAYLALFHSELLQDFNTSVKTSWALAVWLWYLLTLFFYSVLNTHVTRVAKMAMIGFVLISLPFYGVFFKI